MEGLNYSLYRLLQAVVCLVNRCGCWIVQATWYLSHYLAAHYPSKLKLEAQDKSYRDWLDMF